MHNTCTHKHWWPKRHKIRVSICTRQKRMTIYAIWENGDALPLQVSPTNYKKIVGEYSEQNTAVRSRKPNICAQESSNDTRHTKKRERIINPIQSRVLLKQRAVNAYCGLFLYVLIAEALFGWSHMMGVGSCKSVEGRRKDGARSHSGRSVFAI